MENISETKTNSVIFDITQHNQCANNNNRLEKRLESIENLLANQKLEVHNHGESILYTVKRTEQANSRRTR